jgi:histidyl-tRNA synthetase
VRFGSVGGGGRYDGLVSRFRGEPVPATGFSIGVSRLQAALTHARQARHAAGVRPVVVTVFDRDRVADYQKMVARCVAQISAPSSISAIPRTWATSSNMPTGAIRRA